MQGTITLPYYLVIPSAENPLAPVRRQFLIDKFLNEIDLEHIVLETDAPYLSPTPFRGKRNQSNYIPIIAEQLATTLQVDINKVKDLTTRNAISLFNTPKEA